MNLNDYTIDSTENNEYAGSERDENMWEENILDTEVPLDDMIPEARGEYGNPRPEYSEEGLRDDD